MHNAAYHALSSEGVTVRVVAVCDKYVDKVREKTDIHINILMCHNLGATLYLVWTP